MSRVAAPRKAPTASPSQVDPDIPTEKIAMRAYEKWCARGCDHGGDQHDWYEAEQELESEYQRANSR